MAHWLKSVVLFLSAELALLLVAADPNGLLERYPFFHSSSAVDAELRRLSKVCKTMTISTPSNSSDPTVVYFGVVDDSSEAGATGGQTTESNQVAELLNSLPGIDTKKGFIDGIGGQPLRALMVFGEHGRELVTVESGLHFARSLCLNSTEGGGAPWARHVRSFAEFTLVVNANPTGRLRVESGEYCRKTTWPDKVDLSRNYDFHFASLSRHGAFEDWSSGASPFSELGSRSVRNLVDSEKPDVFINVHSGRKGMYMPYAFTDDEVSCDTDKTRMMSVLKSLNNYCNCEFGAAGQLTGVFASGSSLDYAYRSADVPYAFEFEIYQGSGPNILADTQGPDEVDESDDDADEIAPRNRKTRGHGELTLLQGSVLRSAQRSLRGLRRSANGTTAVDDGALLYEQERQRNDADHCLAKFNPLVPEIFQSTLQLWSELYSDVFERIALHRIEGGEKEAQSTPSKKKGHHCTTERRR